MKEENEGGEWEEEEKRRRKEKKKGEEKVKVRRGSGRQKGPIRREIQSQSDIICHSYTDSYWPTDNKWSNYRNKNRIRKRQF